MDRDKATALYRPGRLCAQHGGFTLHARVRVRVHVPGSRPPIARERLSVIADGPVLYRLKPRTGMAPRTCCCPWRPDQSAWAVSPPSIALGTVVRSAKRVSYTRLPGKGHRPGAVAHELVSGKHSTGRVPKHASR